MRWAILPWRPSPFKRPASVSEARYILMARAFQSLSFHGQSRGTKGRDIGLESSRICRKLSIRPGGNGEIPADG
jgi:hypothetical protein